MLHSVCVYYVPCEDGEMLHRDTANVKIIQTPRDIVEAVGRRGVGPKCKGGVQAQVNGAALPQLPLFPRVILNDKEEWYLYFRHGLYRMHLTRGTGDFDSCFWIVFPHSMMFHSVSKEEYK